MRPCMADLLRLSIYKDLEDHASVQNYENMVGVEKNMYFINHTEPEDEDLDGKSKVSAAILLSWRLSSSSTKEIGVKGKN